MNSEQTMLYKTIVHTKSLANEIQSHSNDVMNTQMIEWKDEEEGSLQSDIRNQRKGILLLIAQATAYTEAQGVWTKRRDKRECTVFVFAQCILVCLKTPKRDPPKGDNFKFKLHEWTHFDVS